ncbi:cytochrome c oxidase subunit II [Methylophilaceae bacterium]|nr:cytochrome c oxidase subunit II [Methylophilaceae bacterium]
MLQNLAWAVSLILIAILAGVFVRVIRTSHLTDAGPDAGKSSARWRSRIFWTLAVLFVPVIAYSFTYLPYVPANDAGNDAILVEATGYQWRWELSRETIPVNRVIEFRVTSADVNHGFGIYDDKLRLHTQTQAMPGVTNRLRHTFNVPGTYKILCMEYCGMVHHNMMTEIQVVAEQHDD